ncbi:hypothetical protein Trco_003329 [Trichoderma cornu-damae]|uniref:ER-bound oxygenase mpaB/mpaB'/Rubber oxygenase catalytic domain-containing protein n=1 Tax=Trichoderma cornu-damae TaxID=654480 RepID=A0A9P8QIH8_9HYPO|nr:hypothetical protein Trco_003329 [Trichoderma cornu-damae]
MARHRIGNYSFQWTDTHLPREETDPLRFDYDELGSKAVKKLQQMAREKSRGAAADASYCLGAFDMYAALRDHHAEDETLDQLWREAHTVPDWVDWTQIERGQKFFYRYAPANLMGFALQGFVGENSAASGVVEVLVRTGGFSTRVLLRRLLETLQLVLQVTESLESIQPGGRGHATALRVRLLHSAVRERILRLAEARPDYFDVGRFGVPVNTLDCIHSVATFCCNHMWLQLPRMGVYPSEQETADYIAVFRYVGYLLATPDTYFASVARAKATMESMLVHELRITETSRVVGHNFVECVRDLPPLNMSAGFIEAGSRALNGDELCDSLGLGRAGLLAHACWRGHCWFVRGLALAQRRIPGVDDVVVKYFRRVLGEAVRKSLGGASKMEFRHVPRLGKLTKREANARITSSSSSSSSAAEASLLFLSWPLRRPVEAFYFAVCSGI